MIFAISTGFRLRMTLVVLTLIPMQYLVIRHLTAFLTGNDEGSAHVDPQCSIS